MYILIKEKNKRKIINFELTENSIKLNLKKDIIINNQDLIDQIYLNEIFEVLDELTFTIINYLNSEEDDEDKTGLYYDELAKQRSIILKKYEKFLSKGAIHVYMKNIRFLAIELQKRLKSYKYERKSSKTR